MAAEAAEIVRAAAEPLTHEALVRFCAGRRVVLLGEATHGTREFYRARAEVTRRLIEHHGFDALAIEGDWPDAWQVNRHIRGDLEVPTAGAALAEFKRFPSWMWRNVEVLELVRWLRDFNTRRGERPPVGFYGLDLYSLYASIEAVLEYLDRVDRDAAARARYLYGCLDHYGQDPYAASIGLRPECEGAVMTLLDEVVRRPLPEPHAELELDCRFYAEQSARVVRAAEQYNRTMFLGGNLSWNLRDQHMADTLDALIAHRLRRYGDTRVVVWAHNSHIGDARATELGLRGELNLGQLARERHGGDAVLVGFSTYRGTVTAAREWGASAEPLQLRRALPGSWERLFEDTGVGTFLLRCAPVALELHRWLLERAVGVVYRPATERLSHYFRAQLPSQLDAVVHISETHALQPLERWAPPPSDLPETFPTGM